MAAAAAAAAQFGFSWSKCVSVFGVTIVLSGEERRGVGKKGQYIDWSQRARSVARVGGAALLPALCTSARARRSCKIRSTVVRDGNSLMKRANRQ